MNNDVSTNKYIFTNDWFQHNIESWNVLLQEYVGKENLCFLEIGSYQGMSTAWLMEHVLTHPSSKMYCMDTFEGSVEHSPSQKADLFAIFKYNTAYFGDRIKVLCGYSQKLMRDASSLPMFDFVYIDGDHSAASVLEDAVLSFAHLKKGGLLIFDDYAWTGMPREQDRPKMAIDAFVAIYADKLTVVNVGYQVAIKKTAD